MTTPIFWILLGYFAHQYMTNSASPVGKQTAPQKTRAQKPAAVTRISHSVPAEKLTGDPDSEGFARDLTPPASVVDSMTSKHESGHMEDGVVYYKMGHRSPEIPDTLMDYAAQSSPVQVTSSRADVNTYAIQIWSRPSRSDVDTRVINPAKYA